MKITRFSTLSSAGMLLLGIVLFVLQAQAVAEDNLTPLLIIGSSFESGATPIDNDLNAPLGGIAVGAGSYLALGDALVRRMNGLVINEAEVGAGTIDRVSCGLTFCQTNEKWAGYYTQFEKALLRVAKRDTEFPFTITEYNADYLMIGIPNDCIHSNAFGVPQNDTLPCTLADIDSTIDRIKIIANEAESFGITPIIITYPKFRDLDLQITKELLGFLWVADKSQYNELKNTYEDRLENELPNALLLNPWRIYKHRGDGLHPDRTTITRAAKKIKRLIRRHRRGLPRVIEAEH